MKIAPVLFLIPLTVSIFAAALGSAQKTETEDGVQTIQNEKGGKRGFGPEVKLELVRTISGKSQGPGEFHAAYPMDIDNEDNRFVSDARSRRIEVLLSEGRPLTAAKFSAFSSDRIRSQAQSSQKKLDDVLQKSLEYCLRLDRIALFFISVEDVRERIFNPYRIMMRPGGWKLEEHTYSYDYQLIRKTGLEEERRILVRENGKPCRVEDSPLKTLRFNYKYLAFGPIGLLGETAQRIHSYLVEDEVKIWRKPALVIRVVPREPDNARWLYGRAWVSPADGSVFKIEWQEESLGNYEETLKYAQALKAKPALRFATEYQYEKNGIRFPSRFTVEEVYSQATPGGTRKIRKSELQVTLRDYKFFTVETDVTVRR